MLPKSPASRRNPLLAAASITLLTALPLRAQETPVRFQLDWRFEGPAALFLVPAAKRHFKAEKLDVAIDAGNGPGGTVARVASGTWDMGLADLAALMAFHANNPTAPNWPVAVMLVYSNTPAAVLALKKSGIKTPAAAPGRSSPRPTASRTWPGRRSTRRGARPCWCAATSTPSPASRSPRCSTSRRVA